MGVNIVSHYHRETGNTEAIITVQYHYGTILPVKVEGNGGGSGRRQNQVTLRQDRDSADKVEKVSFPCTWGGGCQLDERELESRRGIMLRKKLLLLVSVWVFSAMVVKERKKKLVKARDIEGGVVGIFRRY